jgi:hypothetical protein
MSAQTRQFSDAPAIRAATPLLVGLFAPTGAGKTFSSLRLATGIQRISGGDIFGVDTESNRMLHYADKFSFRHVPFKAPFSPNDYLAVVDYCVGKGAKTIIVDSMTHEHTGAGGVLEWHSLETERLAKAWGVSAEKAQIAAWKEPKQARRRFIDRLLQVNANFVFCFRAREKIQVRSGKQPLDLGYMPDGAEELFFEMTLGALLLPMSKGVPNWTSEMPGEKAMMKLPEQFVALFGKPRQLDEDTGQRLAEWAAGSVKPETPKAAVTPPSAATGTAPSAGLSAEDIEKLINDLDVQTLEQLEIAYSAGREACRKANDRTARDRLRQVYELAKSGMSATTQESL